MVRSSPVLGMEVAGQLVGGIAERGQEGLDLQGVAFVDDHGRAALDQSLHAVQGLQLVTLDIDLYEADGVDLGKKIDRHHRHRVGAGGAEHGGVDQGRDLVEIVADGNVQGGDAQLGAEQLFRAYRIGGLTLDDMAGRRFILLNQLKYLMSQGDLDRELRWSP